MCGLFGMFSYGDELGIDETNSVTQSLAVESAIRGKDATGIAFVTNGRLEIQKSAKEASKFEANITLIHAN